MQGELTDVYHSQGGNSPPVEKFSMNFGLALERSGDIGDELDCGLARRSRQFVLALDTKYHSAVFTVDMAVRYLLTAGDFCGVHGTGRDAEDTFQVLPTMNLELRSTSDL